MTTGALATTSNVARLELPSVERRLGAMTYRRGLVMATRRTWQPVHSRRAVTLPAANVFC
jgi:hypothetical protein